MKIDRKSAIFSRTAMLSLSFAATFVLVPKLSSASSLEQEMTATVNRFDSAMAHRNANEIRRIAPATYVSRYRKIFSAISTINVMNCDARERFCSVSIEYTDGGATVINVGLGFVKNHWTIRTLSDVEGNPCPTNDF